MNDIVCYVFLVKKISIFFSSSQLLLNRHNVVICMFVNVRWLQLLKYMHSMEVSAFDNKCI